MGIVAVQDGPGVRFDHLDRVGVGVLLLADGLGEPLGQSGETGAAETEIQQNNRNPHSGEAAVTFGRRWIIHRSGIKNPESCVRYVYRGADLI